MTYIQITKQSIIETEIFVPNKRISVIFLSLKIDACTPPQSCLHTSFPTPTPTPSPSNTRDIKWVINKGRELSWHTTLSTLSYTLAAAAAANCSCWPRFCTSYAFHLLISTVASKETHVKYLPFLLNESTGIKQWARLQAQFEYYL